MIASLKCEYRDRVTRFAGKPKQPNFNTKTIEFKFVRDVINTYN